MMYQRQVWKQLLSNKILLDPKTHKFFKSSSLHDLFSLPPDNTTVDPETANIFRESRVKIQERIQEKEKKKNKKKQNPVEFSEDKIQAMKKLAQEIAKNISKPQEQKVEKSSYQLHLEEERQRKLEERQQLKQLSVSELRSLNREKDKERAESPVNKIDDCNSDCSFATALEYSEINAKTYHELKGDRTRKSEEIKKKSKKKSKRKDKESCVVDRSGKVDGEKVDGLIKTEVNEVQEEKHEIGKSCSDQDQYILERLFARKGVSGALQHDSVVNSGIKKHGLRVQTEAQLRADKALEALRKSRLKNWRW